MSAFKKQFGKVDSWFKDLFGPSSLFFDDKQSDSLEAFIVLGNMKRLKLPFGHRRLMFGMKKLMKSKKKTTLDDYYTLPKHLHGAINSVLLGSKIRDSRERVVICFDVLNLGSNVEDQHLLVFCSASGEPLAPIRFKDAVGRKFCVPYHLIQTWEEMKNMVNQAFDKVEVIGPHVNQGHYDIVSVATSEIILPTCWEGVIKPGMEVTMFMWPMAGPPPRAGAPSLPRVAGGPGPLPRPPGAMAPPPPPGAPFRPPPPPVMKPRPAGGVLPIFPPPPPPPAGPKFRRRRSYSSFTSSNSGTDSSALNSCSEIENEETDLGIKFDYEAEAREATIEVKDLLIRWTNAPDVESGPLSSSSWSSSSGSGSDTSLADD